MPNLDERTPSGWPLPFRSNTLEFDVERLRETFNAIDEALSAFEEGTRTLLNEQVAGLEEKQYILDARIDVIAGQTTEDSEILDARVDAEGVTHPNLGHNVRNLHSGLLELGESIQERITEIQQLLGRVAELETGQRESELRIETETQQRLAAIDAEVKTRADADAEILGELVQEALTRNEQDEVLQAQADELSTANLRHSLDLRTERISREQADESLHRELIQSVDDLSSMLGEEAATRSETDNVLHEALEREAQARQALDAALKSESDTRAEQDTALSVRISQNTEDISDVKDKVKREISDRQADIAGEHTDRLSGDEALQAQADELSTASLQHSLELRSEIDQRRKNILQLDMALDSERTSREQADESIHRELIQSMDDLSSMLGEEADSLSIADNILHEALESEARTRQSQDEALKVDIAGEHADRVSNDEALQAQADELSRASLQHSLDLQKEIHQQRKTSEALTVEIAAREALAQDLTIETAERKLSDQELQQSLHDEGLVRLSDDEAQQGQIHSLTKAALRNILDIQQETSCRKSADNEEAEHRRKADETLQQSLETARETLTAEMQAGQNSEADIRSEYDQVLQTQADNLAQASLQTSLNIKETADRQRETLHQEAEQRRSDFLKVKDAVNDEAAKRENADSAETSIRSNDDSALQKQLDSLVFAVLRIALNNYEAREKLRLSIDELFQVVADTGNFTYMGAKIASRSEIGDMLADVLSGTDSGEVFESEIPEALRDKIAASSEVSEMLAEIFPNQNRS